MRVRKDALAVVGGTHGCRSAELILRQVLC